MPSDSLTCCSPGSPIYFSAAVLIVPRNVSAAVQVVLSDVSWGFLQFSIPAFLGGPMVLHDGSADLRIL